MNKPVLVLGVTTLLFATSTAYLDHPGRAPDRGLGITYYTGSDVTADEQIESITGHSAHLRERALQPNPG